MNSVAIIILNWNGIEDTLTCIDSLLLQTYKDFRIVVVDNGSDKASLTALKKLQQQYKEGVEVIYNSKNLGFTGGVNTGIKWAIENEFEYIALFNNDAVADKGWLAALVSAIEPKAIAIATGQLLHIDGQTIDSTGELYSNWGLPFSRNRNEPTVSAPTEKDFVFGATGGATLYRTTLFHEIGVFDDAFFAYYEDADLNFRSQLAGRRAIYTPEAIAYHKQGATSKKLPGFTIYQNFKNTPLVLLKNVPTGIFVAVSARFYLIYILSFWKAVVKGNGFPALKGVIASFILGFGALKKRQQIQKSKKVSTEYIKSILYADLPPEQTGMRRLRRIVTGRV